MEDYESAKKDIREAMNVAGEVPELLYRWLRITYAMEQRDSNDARNAGTEQQSRSRRGTVDPDDDTSRPPLFDWLSPKRKMPESNPEGIRGAADASDGISLWRLRWSP